MPLRLLGPLVVLTTLGLLGSGLALIALGPTAARRPFVNLLGFSLDPLTLHQALIFPFAAATGLHVLARLVPALSLVAGRVQRRVPGRSGRVALVVAAGAAAVVTAVLVLDASGAWKNSRGDRHFRHNDGLGVTVVAAVIPSLGVTGFEPAPSSS